MAYIMSSSCSSSSVPTPSWKYDVFLSFRGEDTRYTFVDHLYAALVQRSICVFKDDEELKIGKAISPELLKAIEESRCAVVVMSKNYANSAWCLLELAKIMGRHIQTGQKVLPVFYHVDPSDIRGQKNDIAVFFQQHEEKFAEAMDKVKEWREALTAIANLSGRHISETGKVGESTYIQKIVEDILVDIHPRDMENDVVGIDSQIDKLNSLLEIEEKEEVRMVGIYGMGGIGKTTIAKALFRRIAYKFEGSSFVGDVRENSSSKRDICALQEYVLREILKINFNVKDPNEGAKIIQARFVRKKVLIVLDDVDDVKQIEFLAAAHDWFGPGSRIIITTRNEQLLSNANAKHRADFMVMGEALELFSRHAFKKHSPPEGYEELSCRAICCAGYLPLAVKVLGSYFHGRNASVWESVFNRLAKAQHVTIFETLKLSFDGLEESEKEIFLDIACFFKGEDVRHVTHVHESCGFDPIIGISVLIEKSLITISNDHSIGMHDLIQQMGRQIARESHPNSRLWQLEDIHVSLKSKQKLESIEAIMVSDKQYDDDEYEEMVGFSPSVFEHMKNLRLLDIKGKFTSSEPTFCPYGLRWIRWRQCPFPSLSTSKMRKLVGLEVLGGDIKQFWDGQKIMTNLKFLRLNHLDSLKMFPDVSVVPNLEKLFLYSCKNLVELHESLGSHKRIFKLYIIGCERLKRLPSRLETESLRFLNLSRCSSLERLPDVSACMVKLSYINLENCSSIEEFPSSVIYLSSLGYLNIRRCTSLREINSSICQDYTKAIESLPKSISLHNLTNSCSLKILNLSYRQVSCEDFPENLHAYAYLEELYLSGNNKLILLPASITQLSRLKKLYLNECHQLQILHALSSKILVLEAKNCYSLEKIEYISEEYDCWYYFSLMNCHKLLGDEDNERYLHKMCQQSFIKRCAVADRELTMLIPGNKIPSWFIEEQPGYNVALMIPPNCNNQITGIAICGVFPGEWNGSHYRPTICFDFIKDGMLISHKEVDCINASTAAAAGENGNTWIYYRPCSSFQGEDWSGGDLLISITRVGGAKAVRCAARLMYKEDVESSQQITTSISYTWLTRRERQKISQIRYQHLPKN